MQSALAWDAKAQPEWELCAQAVFSTLDTLAFWLERQPNPDPHATQANPVQANPVQALLAKVHKGDLARAAIQCRAPARALQYFETHLRGSLEQGWPLVPRQGDYGQGFSMRPRYDGTFGEEEVAAPTACCPESPPRALLSRCTTGLDAA